MIYSGLAEYGLSNYSNYISINSNFKRLVFRAGILCLHSTLIQL